MPRGRALTREDRRMIYNRYVLNGEKQVDIASDLGLSTNAVYKAVKQAREEIDEQMASRSKVVAGDKLHGRLMSTADPKRFEGTCVVNGKCKSRTFQGMDARKAAERWEQWCDSLRAEDEFMAMVERREPERDGQAEPPAATESDVVVNADPIPKAAYPAPCFVSEEKGRQTLATVPPEVVYAIVATKPELKGYGYYTSLQKAYDKIDELNEVSKLLGVEDAFDVHELRLKG